MWHQRLRAAAVLATGVIAGSTIAAPGQDFLSGFAPRCLTSELQASVSSPDTCEAPPAGVGLTGPAVVSAGGTDIETTGSISVPTMPSEAEADAERRR